MPNENPCDSCPHHENVEFRLKTHTERLNAHSDKMDTLDTCVVKLAAIEEQNAKMLAEVRESVDELKGRPAKQWTTAQNVALTVVVTAAVNAALQGIQFL